MVAMKSATRRPVIVLFVACVLGVTTIAFLAHLPAGKHFRASLFSSESLHIPPTAQSVFSGAASSRGPIAHTLKPHFSVESGARWWFDSSKDSNNYGLSDSQCDAAFPGYFEETYQTAAYWRNFRNITKDDVDISWRHNEMVRAMIFDRQLYIIETKWHEELLDVPRALATLFSIQRSIDAFPGPLPNIEFSFCMGDIASKPEEKHATWVLSKRREQEEQWILPDFGYWSWPKEVMGEYNQVRREIKESEPAWNDKKPQLVWRGATATNPLREDLIEASKGKSWSDVQAISWASTSTGFLSMPQHCQYRYVVHTEGHSYSGRAKYLLNCASVSITHKIDWIEPHTHLLVSSGPDQNVVVVERNFKDLDSKMNYLLKHPEVAQRIAKNSADIFRDRYLTPAAQSCYWRKLFWAWSSVSFEPELFEQVKDGEGRMKRQSRGTPFETFVARLQVEGP